MWISKGVAEAGRNLVVPTSLKIAGSKISSPMASQRDADPRSPSLNAAAPGKEPAMNSRMCLTGCMGPIECPWNIAIMMINQWLEWRGYNWVAYFKTNPFLQYLLWVCKLTPMSWFRSQCFRGVFMHQLTTYLKCIRYVPWTPSAWAQHSYRPGWCP